MVPLISFILENISGCSCQPVSLTVTLPATVDTGRRSENIRGQEGVSCGGEADWWQHFNKEKAITPVTFCCSVNMVFIPGCFIIFSCYLFTTFVLVRAGLMNFAGHQRNLHVDINSSAVWQDDSLIQLAELLKHLSVCVIVEYDSGRNVDQTVLLTVVLACALRLVTLTLIIFAL